MNFTKYMVIIIIFLMAGELFAQRRGDQLAFQGLSTPEDAGVKAVAMGGALTAVYGELGSLYRNPAGLAGLKSLQLSIGGTSSNRSWQENQEYRPNRIYETLPFYLEGLYTPEPRYNGVWDYELAGTLGFDSVQYIIRQPDLGLDPFSEEAADWKHKLSRSGLNNVAAALPLTVANRQLVIAAGFSQNVLINDFDRNETFLDPHIGFNLYGNPNRATTTDTVTFNWSRFQRQREGNLSNITGALAYEVNPMIQLGLGLNIASADTDDELVLDRVGFFEMVGNNKFRFSYDTVATHVVGTSEFSATQFNLGILLKLQRFNIGARLGTPYSLTRKWRLASTTTTVDSGVTGSISLNQSGEDKIEIPTSLQFGISVTPVDNITFALDLDYIPYSKADYTLTSQPQDSLFQKWADYQSLRFGLEFRPTSYLSLMTGYRSLPSTFVPDGAAFDENGPTANSYTFGASVSLWNIGRVDVAYEWRRLRYHDSYYSNTNYVQETLNNLYFGYVYQF